jgi:signal transduction histidine kinase
MENKKEINSVQCFLTNSSYYSRIIEVSNDDPKTAITRKKLVNEIGVLEKSVANLQNEKDRLNLRLLHEQKILKKSNQVFQNDIHNGLEEIMFIVSHKIRVPLTNILGLSNLLTINANSDQENLELIDLIKKSATDLDFFTKELALYIKELDAKREQNSH